MKKTKEEKAKAKLAKLLGLEEPEPVSAVEQHDIKMEAEAALEYAENPRTFTHKDCKLCKRTFATRGAPVAYCSNPCRIKSFEERLGVRWSPDRRPEDRWGFMGEPLIVPPEALPIIQQAMEAQVVSDPEPKPSAVNALIETIYAPVIEQQKEHHEGLMQRLGMNEPEPSDTAPDEVELDPATLDILRELGLQ